MWILQLNMMRNRSESVTVVGWAETQPELAAYLEREKDPGGPWVDAYGLPSGFDGGQACWNKTFKAGSPLEYFNEPTPDGRVAPGVFAYRDLGTEADWIREAVESYAKVKTRFLKIGP